MLYKYVLNLLNRPSGNNKSKMAASTGKLRIGPHSLHNETQSILVKFDIKLVLFILAAIYMVNSLKNDRKGKWVFAETPTSLSNEEGRWSHSPQMSLIPHAFRPSFKTF